MIEAVEERRYCADTAGNTPGAARVLGTINNVTKTVVEQVSTTDHDDFYKFTTGATGNTTVRIDGLSSNADLQLYNSTGSTLLASSSNTGTTADQIIKSLSAGTYIARVKWVGPSTVNYNLKLTGPAIPVDPGNSTATAKDLGNIGTSFVNFSNSVGGADNYDYFKIKTTANGMIRAKLTSLSGDAGIAIYDTSGNLLDYSNDPGTQLDAVYHGSAAATYYILVYNNFSNTVNYTVQINNGAVPPDGAGNNPGLAKDLGVVGTKTLSDFIVSKFDHDDFYKITVMHPGNIVANLSGMGGDLNVSINNSSGTELVRSTSTSRSSDSVTFNAPIGGVFYVRVFQGTTYGGGFGPGNNGPSSPYTLAITAPVDVAPNVRTSAKPLIGDTTLTGWVGVADHEDWYKITAGAGGVAASVTPTTQDVDIELYNSSGTLIDFSTAGGTTVDSVSASGSGVYYIRVFQGISTSNSFYSLQVAV